MAGLEKSLIRSLLIPPWHPEVVAMIYHGRQCFDFCKGSLPRNVPKMYRCPKNRANTCNAFHFHSLLHYQGVICYVWLASLVGPAQSLYIILYIYYYIIIILLLEIIILVLILYRNYFIY